MRRRSLLQWMAASLSGLPALRGRAAAAPGLGPESEDTLRGLATSVLPGSLGAERIEKITNRFSLWLRSYRPDAELDHGYGHTKLRTTGISPLAGYAAQLAALERAAKAEGSSFALLKPERQRALVAAGLAAARVSDLPERPDGRHVAADLLAFFFRSSEASDLCYGVAIDRDACRGLPGSEEAPPPLEEGR